MLGGVASVAPHPAKPWFATCSHDKTLKLWDARKRRLLSAAKLTEQVCINDFLFSGEFV